jgi:hypothetical protein
MSSLLFLLVRAGTGPIQKQRVEKYIPPLDGREEHVGREI